MHSSKVILRVNVEKIADKWVVEIEYNHPNARY